MLKNYHNQIILNITKKPTKDLNVNNLKWTITTLVFYEH